MWPFKKKVVKVQEKPTKTIRVKAGIEKVTLCCYTVQIFNEKEVLISEGGFGDSLHYGWDIYGYAKEAFEPGFVGRDESEHQKFQSFKQCPTLALEDCDGNEVILSTDNVKKIIITVDDEFVEEVQLYKNVEVEVNVEEAKR
jgi:hypothetical protein